MVYSCHPDIFPWRRSGGLCVSLAISLVGRPLARTLDCSDGSRSHATLAYADAFLAGGLQSSRGNKPFPLVANDCGSLGDVDISGSGCGTMGYRGFSWSKGDRHACVSEGEISPFLPIGSGCIQIEPDSLEN